jgi:hypothetical protein
MSPGRGENTAQIQRRTAGQGPEAAFDVDQEGGGDLLQLRPQREAADPEFTDEL